MKFLRILILLIVLVVGLFFIEMKYDFLPQKYRQQLDNFVGRFFGTDPENLEQITSTSNLELSTLKDRSGEITGQVQEIFSKAVEPSSEEKPLHDRAFEYGRYLYCQEVVKSYEKQNP